MIDQPRAQRDAEFHAAIDLWVWSAIARGHARFEALLITLPGVYPEAVLASLRRLVASGRIPNRILIEAERFIRQDPVPPSPSITDYLPLPHPVEFEWRFSEGACRDLLRLAQQLTRSRDRILLYGTPSLAAVAMEEGVRDRAIDFIGEDNLVTSAVRQRNRQLGAPLKVFTSRQGYAMARVAAVVLDPPWYFDFIKPMVRSAARVCQPGGIVIMSLPPFGTRSSAISDRPKTIRLAERYGLTWLMDGPAAIAYMSPFFERNALRAAGFQNIPADWRRGDLVVFRKKFDAAVEPIPPKFQSRWRELALDGIRFFATRASSARPLTVGLEPVVDGEIFPTVSRRDVRRGAGHVWTSGNRLFRCSRSDLLLPAVNLARGVATERTGKSNYSHQDQQEIRRLATRLHQISAQEKLEHLALGGVKPQWPKNSASVSAMLPVA